MATRKKARLKDADQSSGMGDIALLTSILENVREVLVPLLDGRPRPPRGSGVQRLLFPGSTVAWLALEISAPPQ